MPRELKGATKRARLSPFFCFTFLFTAGMIVDFALTPNPFAAFHAYDDNAGQLSTYFLVPAYLLLIAGAIVLVTRNRISGFTPAYILATLMLLSGFANGLLGSLQRTYGLSLVLLLMTASLAVLEARTNHSCPNIPRLRLVTRLLTTVLILGVFLAWGFDGRYGHLPFEFSRQSRGEVTLWHLTGLMAVFPTLALVAHRQHRMRYPIVLALGMLVIIASTVSRASFATALLPLLIFLVFQLKSATRFVAYLALTGASFLILEPLIDFFGSVGGNTQGDATSGRNDLWSFHYQTFLDHWLFGAGSNIVSRSPNYTGNARVEVGLLAWFSEYGLFFGALMAALVVRAIVQAVSLLRAGKQTGNPQFFFALIMLTLAPSLVEKFSRILTVEDFVFWFTVFYLNAHVQLVRSERGHIEGPAVDYQVLRKPWAKSAPRQWPK